ncbi:MAG: RluA family pseudouridine synthase [Pseudomonadales bacterium]
MSIDVLHADQALIVVNKPEFVRSVPGSPSATDPTVLGLVLHDYPDAKIVHRLDMDTSGLMLLARGDDAQRSMNLQFQQRAVKKQYTAIAAGHIHDCWGCIDLPINKDWPNRPRQRIDFNKGKAALTYYRVDSRISYGPQYSDASRLTLFPDTGRSHQLRIHMRCLGHPLLGCDLYGNEHSYSQSSRLLLHATRLEFIHPASGENFVIEHQAPF